MSKVPVSRSLTGVLVFSFFAGIVSGFLMASHFMPAYSLYYNWRQWHPGTQEITVLGEVPDFAESRVIYAADWDNLRDLGMPSSRLWLFNSKTAEQPEYALIAHGIWRNEKIELGDEISLTLADETKTVPVAGIWHPFHPQLGDNWVVLVGGADIPAASSWDTEVLNPVENAAKFPPAYQGRNLLSWMLFNTFGFLLYGAIGLLDRKGRYTTMGWAVKLWAGGGVAIFTGLISAVFIFRAYLPLPVLGLLPMTLGLLAASYMLAVLLLTALCVVLARLN